MNVESQVDAVTLLRVVSRVLASVAKTASREETQISRKAFLEEIHIDLKLLNLHLLKISNNREDLSVSLANKILLQHSLLESLSLIVFVTELEDIFRQVQQESDSIGLLSAINERFNPKLQSFHLLRQLYIYIEFTPPVTRTSRFDQNPRLLNANINSAGRQRFTERLRSTNLGLAQIKKPLNVLLEASKNVADRLNCLYKTLHYNWPECQHCPNMDHPAHTLFHCTSAKLHMNGAWSEVPPGRKEFDVVLCGHSTFHECVVDVSLEHQFPLDKQLKRICQCRANATIRLSLKADTSNNLWDSQPLEEVANEAAIMWAKFEEITLDRVVPYNEFNHGEKMILSLILARSFLDMLGTGWLPDEWGMKHISVFRNKIKSDEITIRNPYLSTKFQRNALASSTDGRMLHQRPQVLRLGIVLMQLLLADRMKGSGDEFKVEVGEHVNSAVPLARELLEACKSRFPRNWTLLQGIEQCIDPQAFYHHNVAKNNDKLRQFIYQHIVLPLEDAVVENERPSSTPGLVPSLTQILDGAAPNAILSNPPEIAQSTEDITQYEQPSFGEHHKKDSKVKVYSLAKLQKCSEKEPTGIAKDWKGKLGTMRDFLDNVFPRHSPLKPLEWDNLVKIAILDTGCDMKHPMIAKRLGSEKEYRPGIIGCRNLLVENLSAATDLTLMTDTTEDRHGTFMTHLVLDTMPYVRLYIAKVFDKNDAQSERCHKDVADAIKYAVDVWKVDIISMSFNLHNPTRLVKDMIQYAADQKVLLFAAACNDLHMEAKSRGFPADDETRVFCVNSHDGNGKDSGFTPKAFSDRANFAALGEGLEGPGKMNGTQFMNGTSCATPIAAAYAAIVLDFCTQLSSQAKPKTWMTTMDKVWVNGKNQLKDCWLMKKVFFYRMVEDPRRGHYNTVKPWKLFSLEHTEHIRTKEEMQERLRVISQKLVDTMENRDSKAVIS